MRKVSEISFASGLTVLAVILTGLSIASPSQPIDYSADSDITFSSIADGMLQATPYPALLLSEIVVENDSEIEPKQSGSLSVSSAFDCQFGIKAYLNKSKRLLISLKIRDLIFPFHTYL